MMNYATSSSIARQSASARHMNGIERLASLRDLTLVARV
jgi:hypothetical protein